MADGTAEDVGGGRGVVTLSQTERNLPTIANVDARDFSDLACWLIVQIGPISLNVTTPLRLISDCDDWRRAADIRAFVAAVDGSQLARKNAEAFAKWCLWALAHADRIDSPTDEDIFDQGVDDYEVYSLRE